MDPLKICILLCREQLTLGNPLFKELLTGNEALNK